MRIRRACIEDIDIVIGFGINLLEQHAELDKYFTPKKDADKLYRLFLERSLELEDHIFLVAEDSSKLIGYAVAEIQRRSEVFVVAENGYINDVFVMAEYRKKGIANMFLKEIRDWFVGKKVDYVELTVHPNNEIGKRAWSKFGFKDFELRQRVDIGDFIL